MRLIIEENHEKASNWVSNYISNALNSAKKAGNSFVLGLPTGSSPLLIYKNLIEMYKKGELSFKDVKTFNMDEYVGLGKDHPQSYYRFMRENFFDHIDIIEKNARLLDGLAKNLEEECALYEKEIGLAGGIDLFLGGMGEDGHIAFNEPGSSLSSRTRVKTLTPDTIKANARFFSGDVSKVPKTALTVGVGTIMDAREVVIIVSGLAKARALRAVVEEGISQMWTLSCLQMHPKAIIVCDEDASAELKVGTAKYFKNIENIKI